MTKYDLPMKHLGLAWYQFIDCLRDNNLFDAYESEWLYIENDDQKEKRLVMKYIRKLSKLTLQFYIIYNIKHKENGLKNQTKMNLTGV